MLFDPPQIIFLKHSLICYATTKGRHMTDGQTQNNKREKTHIGFFRGSTPSSAPVWRFTKETENPLKWMKGVSLRVSDMQSEEGILHWNEKKIIIVDSDSKHYGGL